MNILEHVPCDFKYIDSVCVEYIEKLNLNVLYVPDNWSANPDITLADVKKAIAEKGLVEVDIAIMHGCFGYCAAASF